MSKLTRVVAVTVPAPGHLSGDGDQAMELFVGLNGGARLKPPGTPGQPYRINRQVNGVTVWSGTLVYDNGKWLLHSGDDDDPVWLLEVGAMRPGEYLGLRGPEGESFMFRILDAGFPEGNLAQTEST